MTHKLLDDDKWREGYTSIFLGLKEFERNVMAELADLRKEVESLRNRVEILEIQQVNRDV